MLTVAEYSGPGPPARPKRPRADSSPPVLRGARAVAGLAALTLAAPRVALTGRYRGARVHAAAYVAALCAVLLGCLALWGGAVGGGLLTVCDTRLPRPAAAALCGASRVLVANEQQGLRVVDTRGIRSLYLDGELQTRMRANGEPLRGYERRVVNSALDALAALRAAPRADATPAGQPPRAPGSAVALLGLGGGSLAADLRRHCGSDCGRIAVAEHSVDVIAAARAHFARDAAPVSYVHADARAFLAAQPDGAFDLVVNDALTGGSALRQREREAAESLGRPLPQPQLSHAPFMALAHAKLRRGGAYIVVVRSPGYGPLAQPLRDALRRLQSEFRAVRLEPASWADAWSPFARHHVIVATK